MEKQLTEKQEMFCLEYVKDFNASRAYKAVYPDAKEDTARVNASRLLTNANIQEFIAGIVSGIKAKKLVEVEDLILELKKIAFADLKDILDPDWSIKSLADIKDTSIIESVEIIKDKETGEVIRIKPKLYSKLEGIEKLMRYAGGYEKDNEQKSKVKFEGLTDEEVKQQLDDIRKRKQE